MPRRLVRVFLATLVLFQAFLCAGFAAEQLVNTLSPLRDGDLIHVKVLNNRSMVEVDQDLTVNSSGDMDVPLLGLSKVKGLNISQIQAFLAKEFAEKVFQGPRVQVTIVKLALSDKVFVFGGVKKPGPVSMRDFITVMDAISAADGFEDANLFGNNWLTNPTDPRSNQAGFQVTQSFDYLSETKVKRAGKDITVDLKKLIQDGDITQNINLENNDVIIIPRRTSVVPKDDETLYILGAVQFPARYRYRNGMGVSDAISMAGGLVNQHYIKFASIIRGVKRGQKVPSVDPRHRKDEKVAKASGQPEIIKVDLRQFYFRGDINSDPILKAGDILLVSTREYRNFLSQVGRFVDSFLPIMSRANQVIGYDDTIRKFNDRFVK